jgi:hypothetical protein
MVAFAAAILLVGATAAGATKKAAGDDGGQRSAGADTAKPHIVVTVEDCRRLVRYRDTGSAEYTPGVDVYGKPVTPAEVENAPTVNLPESIEIEIGIDIAEKYGFGAGGDYTGEARLGRVTVRDGLVYFNGQALGDAVQEDVARACERLLGKAK